MRNFIILVLAAMVLTGFSNSINAQCQVNFNSTSSVNLNGFPDSLASGDFNRDGRLDLAVVSKNFASVSVLINQGGSFALTVSYDIGSSPSSIVAADFDKDGKIDLAITNQSSNNFTLLKGNGLGGFTGGTTFNTQANPSSLTFADFNRDGAQDIAVVHLGGTTISIFFGDGTGNFVNSLNIGDGNFRGGASIIAADLNLDGVPDIVAVGRKLDGGFEYATTITALGNGAGGFSAVTFHDSSDFAAETTDVKAADINRDGKPDLVVTNNSTFNNAVFYARALGNGTDTFTFQGNVYLYDGNIRALVLTDINFDGKIDFVVSQEFTSSTDNFFTLLGDGNGSYLLPLRTFNTGGGNTQRIITADFNGDGKPDIASTNSTQNKVNITLNTCGGLKPYPKADFDGDGKTDLAIFRPSLGEWWYLKSSTGGNGAVQFGSSTDRITSGDFTGDGKTDVAFFRPSTGFWFVLRSEDFSFYSFPFGANGDIPATGDYDGDGKTDAAVFRPSDSTWYISRSSGGTTIQQFGQSGDVPVAGD